MSLHLERTVANMDLDLKVQVVQAALDNANITESDLSAVAVTIGPGLSLCLRGNQK